MNSITLTYHPIPFLRVARTVTGAHPENWKEITGPQLEAIAKSYIKPLPKHRFLAVMTGIKPRIIKRLGDYQHYKLLELIEFVNKPAPLSAFVIPQLKSEGKMLNAPGPLLKGMSFGRFIFADSFFRNYNETKNPDEMARFLAALYIPAGKKFREKLIEQNQPITAKVKPVTAEAIRLNYMMVFEWLMDIYPLIFPREPAGAADSDLSQSDPSGQSVPKAGADLQSVPKARDPRAWVKIFESLVGDDIVNQDKYANLPLHTVFRYFTKNIKENMKSRKKK